MLHRLRYIRRWGLMRNQIPENVQEHSHEVAALAHLLAVVRKRYFAEGRVCPDPATVALHGIFHDITEILTGDMPTPAKYFSHEMRRNYGVLENAAANHLLSMLPEDLKDEAARIAALRTGTVHISSITPEAATLLQGQANLNIIEYPTLNYMYWAFNVTKPPFDDPRVRLAMSWAIDRQEIIDVVFNGQAVLTGPVPASNVAWALPIEEFPSYQTDREKAKALLAEAGYADGLSFKIKTAASYPHYIDTAVTIQHQLKQIGVDVEIELVEWGAYIDAWTNNDHDSMVGNNGGGQTPDRSLYFFFHTDGTANVWGFSDPVFDELTIRGKTTVDPQKRWEIYAEAQRMLVNDLAPNLFLCTPTQFYAVSKDIDGFYPTAFSGERQFRYTYFK